MAGTPAVSQPLPKPKPNSERAHQALSHRADHSKTAQHGERLVSMPLTHEPAQPALGWPALVREARKYIGTNPTDRKRLWCATFMNMVLAKAGYRGTNSDAAKSFASYGHRIYQPKVGAIAVLTRGERGGHVGVVSGIDANGNPIVISGNHGNRVGEAIYPRSRVIAYVMPAEGQPADTQYAERGTSGRAMAEGGIDSPITELIAAIEAEQSRAERPAAQPTQLPAPHLTVQQTAAPSAQARRELPLASGLAEFFGVKERAQTPPRVAPQREQRVEHERSGRVAEASGLARFLGLPLPR